MDTPEPGPSQQLPRTQSQKCKGPAGRPKPVEQRPIQVHRAGIKPLDEDNAAFWFYSMEQHMKCLGCWQAISFYESVGETEYQRALDEDKDWERVNLMAEVAIEKEISPTLVLDIRDEPNAPKKWNCLKTMYLLPYGSGRISKLINMFNSMGNEQSDSDEETKQAIHKTVAECVALNGSPNIDVKEILMAMYIRGLQSHPLRDSLLRSKAPLSMDYIERRIIEFDRTESELNSFIER